jgi:hypothetical protein
MKISELYDLHEEAEDLFQTTSDPYAKDALSQSLCCTRILIPLWEAADAAEREEMEEDIDGAISFTREKIAIAMEILACPQTERNIG